MFTYVYNHTEHKVKLFSTNVVHWLTPNSIEKIRVGIADTFLIEGISSVCLISTRRISKMITFNKLLERAKSEKIAVHTATEAQAITLLKALDKKGYRWNGEAKLTDCSNFEVYKENTCYNFSTYTDGALLNKKVVYGPLSLYQEHYTIIEFTDIDFEEK